MEKPTEWFHIFADTKEIMGMPNEKVTRSHSIVKKLSGQKKTVPLGKPKIYEDVD